MQLAAAAQQQQQRRCVAAPAAAVTSTPAAPRASKRGQQQGSQRLFLDSADVREWERWAPTGTLWGFTTNPLILERDGVPCSLASCKQLLASARRLGAAELQCQAWGGSTDALAASAFALLELDPDFITVKLPCTAEGLVAASTVLSTDPQASITITGVYTAHQALLAQAVGADYCAPYLGRMADARQQQPGGPDSPGAAMQAAADEVAAMQAGVRASGSRMRILVASIRSAADMAALAARGCDTFTFSPAVMAETMGVPATLTAAADFEAAAARNQ